ncbi:G-protein alpha subunit-domain-containing protein [Phellopilus nigrolimitatus]|nr:G-protein alpha subunit-domain-containing protein [Phellopilus nigrolimitatus]
MAGAGQSSSQLRPSALTIWRIMVGVVLTMRLLTCCALVLASVRFEPPAIVKANEFSGVHLFNLVLLIPKRRFQLTRVPFVALPIAHSEPACVLADGERHAEGDAEQAGEKWCTGERERKTTHRDSLMDITKRLGAVRKRVIEGVGKGTTKVASEQLLRSDSSCIPNSMEAYASVQDRTDTERSEEIDRHIEEDSRKLREEYKILLLSSVESGKSTIMKHMKIIHQNGVHTRRVRVVLLRNLSVDPVLRADAILDYKLDSSGAGAGAAMAAFSEDVVGTTNALWADLIIPRIMDHDSAFYLTDSALYFFSEVGRIGSTGYVPALTDALRARQKSTGIVKTRFNMGQLSIHMFGVGDQRSKCKKRMHVARDA